MKMLEAGYKHLLQDRYKHEEFERFKAYWDTRHQRIQVSGEMAGKLDLLSTHLLLSWILCLTLTFVIPLLLFSREIFFKKVGFAFYSLLICGAWACASLGYLYFARRKLIEHRTQHGLNDEDDATFKALIAAKDNMEQFPGFVFRWDEEQVAVQQRYRDLAKEMILASLVCKSIGDDTGELMRKQLLSKHDHYDKFGLGCPHGDYYAYANQQRERALREVARKINILLTRV